MIGNAYIIGDIHGCYDTFITLLNKLDLNEDYSNLILVGDIIDRGPKSRDMINFVRKHNITMVQGNHEEMMCSSIEDMIEYNTPLSISDWVANGGDKVLAEYNDSDGNIDNESLQEDYEFLLNLPVVYIDSKLTDEKGRQLLVTHTTAGDVIENYLDAVEKLNGNDYTEHLEIEYKHQVSNSEMLMQWDRRVPNKIQEKYFNVFGHTPISHYYDKQGLGGCLTPEGIVVDTTKGFANIDTGCVYQNNDSSGMLGKMTAIKFPSLEVIQQENLDVV